MASLGFRPPQFSEDAAWLPAWLQHHQAEYFDEHVRGTQTHSGQAFNVSDALLQGSMNKDVDILSSEEGRYKSCHLFLSGIDNSPSSCFSSRNALHFHLHLSLGDSSQSMRSPLLGESHVDRRHLEPAFPMQDADNSAGAEEKAPQGRLVHTTGPMHALPPILDPKSSENGNLGNLFSNEDADWKSQDESDIKNQAVDDDSGAAVELSIAASEALAIHELVKSGSIAEALPATTVLEVALRVKEARLEGSEAASHFLVDEIDENDSISDLDESEIEDALEDIGLSMTRPDDLHVSNSIRSWVEDTPTSPYPYECNNNASYVESQSQGTNFDNISITEKLNDLPLTAIASENGLATEHFDFVEQEKFCGEECLQFNPTLHANGSLHEVMQPVPDVAVRKRVNINITSSQSQRNLNSFLSAASFENSGKVHEVSTLLPNRFSSRWLGGWMGKETGEAASKGIDNANNVPKFYVTETSFLSESADVVPDINSFVQEQASGLKATSQCIRPADGLHDKADERVMLSHEVVGSPSISLSDPLCSIVPCSLTSVKDDLTHSQNENGGEVYANKSLCPMSEHAKENLSSEVFQWDTQPASKINVGSSAATVCRRLTSLKGYSMLLPNSGTVLKEGINSCNLALPPSDNHFDIIHSGMDKNCSTSSNEKKSTGFLLRPSISKCCAIRDWKERYQADYNETELIELENKRSTKDGNVKHAEIQSSLKDGAEQQIDSPIEMNLPYNLDRRIRRRLQAPKNFIGDDPLQTLAIEKEIQQREKPQNLQSGCISPHDIRLTAEKSVRFAEAEVELQLHSNLQRVQLAQESRSTTKVGEKLRNFNMQSISRTRKVKPCFNNHRAKHKNGLIFQGIEFLLMGYCTQKEKEIVELIRKYGGAVLFDIPSPNSGRKRKLRSGWQQHPIVLCEEKLQTTQFLYGCAVDALVLKVDWLAESIAAGSLLPPEKYMIIPRGGDYGGSSRFGKHGRRKHNNHIFDRVGIMLHGNLSFCTKIAMVVKHGGGQVFKTLHRLVQTLDNKKISLGAIVTEDGSRTSRHLRHCALEKDIPTVSASWVINSLHLGKLLPFPGNSVSCSSTKLKLPVLPVPVELSEEI